MAHIFVSLYDGKPCASLITLLADYQIGPLFNTLLVMFLDESPIVEYFATQQLFINTYCQCAYIKIIISSKRFVARISFMFHCLVHNFTFCGTSRTSCFLFQSILLVQYFVQFYEG